MRFSPRVALWLLLAFFAAVAGALAWSLIHDAFSTFPAGKPPVDVNEAPRAAKPTLPPLRSSDPSIGSVDPNALTIVEFGDYRCASCRAAQTELSSALSQYEGNVRFVWRDAPISSAPEAYLPARAARCAGDQGHFWELHDAIYNMNAFDAQSLSQKAAQLGLDPRLFNTCLSSDAYRALLDEDLSIAKTYGIKSVPTFFINGVAYEGLVTSEEFLSAFQRNKEQP